MKTDHTLSVARLRRLVRYTPDDGHFYRPDGEMVPESKAGRYGRLQIHIDGRMRYAARCAYAYMYGEWPSGQIDHINGDHTDNRLANLRNVTNKQNAQNRRRAKVNNRTGLMGVTRDARGGRYRARIMVDGRMISLGFYSTPEEAHDAYLAAKRRLHPYWVEDAA